MLLCVQILQLRAFLRVHPGRSLQHVSLASEDLWGTSSGNDITQDTSCTTKTSNIHGVNWLKDVNICVFLCVYRTARQTVGWFWRPMSWRGLSTSTEGPWWKSRWIVYHVTDRFSSSGVTFSHGALQCVSGPKHRAAHQFSVGQQQRQHQHITPALLQPTLRPNLLQQRVRPAVWRGRQRLLLLLGSGLPGNLQPVTALIGQSYPGPAPLTTNWTDV